MTRAQNGTRAVTHLGLDPQNELVHTVISKLTDIDPTRLRAIEAGTFFYATLHTFEGIGLILEKPGPAISS